MPSSEIKIHQAITLNSSVVDIVDTLGLFPQFYKEILRKLLEKQRLLLLSAAEQQYTDTFINPNQLKLFSDENQD